jgi:hypothetical protein
MALIRNLTNPAPPSLPLAPEQYERRYQDQYSNVFRLYFNQLSNALQALFGPNGGSYLEFPHIAALDTTTQYATASNTPTIVEWNTLDAGRGFTLNANSTATAQVSGLYKITYSLQFANTANDVHDAVVWLRSNGPVTTSANDVPNSTTVFTLQARKSAEVPNFVCGYSEVVFALNAGDSVGLWWGTTQAATSGGGTGVYMDARPAQTTPMTYPAVPSAIGSITFVSALPP